MVNSTVQRCCTALLLLAIFASGCVYLYYHAPTPDNRWLPKCAFHQITHLYCPGCGATRALYSLLHGDLVMMFRYNPLMIPILGAVLLVIIKPKLSASNYFVVPLLCVIIFYWILRNLPWFPFTLLAPPSL